MIESRIICIGNRLAAEDRAGLQVYDHLLGKKIPNSIEVIEGGIAGLDLLCFLENVFTIVFVDAVAGFTSPGKIIVMDQAEIKEKLYSVHYGHDAGIAYLLTVLPKVCQGDLPHKIFLVGLEGICSPETIAEAADLALLTAAEKTV